MAVIERVSIEDIAKSLARALVSTSSREQTARLSLPLLYPGGSMVGVEISRLRSGFLVSDAGSALREAGLLGGERWFGRMARDVAEQFAVRYDHNMIFDLDVCEDELLGAVVAVGNAAKSAVERTAIQLATVDHADYRADLWDRLERAYGGKAFQREPVPFRGSTEDWRFDAGVRVDDRLVLFEVVTPFAASVNSAVTKFLDVKDLGEAVAPARIAILVNLEKTQHRAVLGRTARLLPIDASDEAYRAAA